MLSTHIKLRQEIEEAYSAVMKESKFLLAALQKPSQENEEFVERTAEFSDSSSHIMDIYLNVHDQHRQLGILWEKQRSRLRQHLHICTFENDSEQVRVLCFFTSLVLIVWLCSWWIVCLQEFGTSVFIWTWWNCLVIIMMGYSYLPWKRRPLIFHVEY